MFNLQPTLENDIIKIQPLKTTDFEMLYNAACDPLIWEQHPNKDRYKKEVFENFFKGAIESGGAFLILDAEHNTVIGSSRFYDATEQSVLIGYTFFAKNYWGGKYNPSLKKLMIDYAFNYVNKVIFHIGAQNIRSQKAIERLGAKKVSEIDVAYYGEPKKLNFVYEIKKENWEG